VYELTDREQKYLAERADDLELQHARIALLLEQFAKWKRKSVRAGQSAMTLDAATRGGSLLRKVAVIGGARGAGKTALLVRLAYTWLRRGVPVGVLASDKDADGLLTRFGQLGEPERPTIRFIARKGMHQRALLANLKDRFCSRALDGGISPRTGSSISRRHPR
jgi:predicted ATP-dependent serine protease